MPSYLLAFRCQIFFFVLFVGTGLLTEFVISDLRVSYSLVKQRISYCVATILGVDAERTVVLNPSPVSIDTFGLAPPKYISLSEESPPFIL